MLHASQVQLLKKEAIKIILSDINENIKKAAQAGSEDLKWFIKHHISDNVIREIIQEINNNGYIVRDITLPPSIDFETYETYQYKRVYLISWEK